MYERFRRRLFRILELAESGDVPSKAFDIFILTLIVLNVLAVMLESVEGLASRYAGSFSRFEIFSVAVFTVEYVLRMWTCTAERQWRGAVLGRMRFMRTPLAIIDLMAVLPFYLPMFIPLDLRFLRVLRLFRLFRLLKVARYTESLRLMGVVVKRRKEELLVTLFVIVILLVLASSAMYLAENEAQPEKFSSIPTSMWWAVVTLTTVGYGDTYPVTLAGRVTGAIVALLGIGMIALPTGILGSGFIEELQRRRRKTNPQRCPHCGQPLDVE